MAFVGSLVFGHLTQAQGLPASEPAPGIAELDAATLAQVVTGRVCLPDGSPAASVVVVTSAGGEAITGADGSFALAVELPLEEESVEVTAVADLATGSGSLVASARLVPAALSATTSTGRLVLTLSPSCVPRWLPTFGTQPGTDGTIRALTVFDDGSGPALYAGGEFRGAVGVAANRVAKWNGSSWTALGSGMDDTVHALAVYDDGSGPALFAGGEFSSAGGTPVNFLARWDGSSWAALGSGTNAAVFGLTVLDDGGGPALFAGGTFTIAGGVTASRIAKWDGASWSALGSGLNNYAKALAVYDDGMGPALYAGGAFTTAGGVTALRIARWNGSAWSALDSGLSGSSQPLADDLAVYDDGSGPALYAGGSFTVAGGAAASRIAKWDGSSWSALGDGITGGPFPLVSGLTVYDDGNGPALYVGGSFTAAGGAAASSIAKWDGSSWSALSSGFNCCTVDALTVFDDGSGPALFAGGNFSSAGTQVARNLARWDGASWAALGDQAWVNARVAALTVHDDGGGPALYAGGDFTAAGEVAPSRIARWDGASWTTLGVGIGGTVMALATYDDGGGPALYAGGTFAFAGGLLANHIAKWDGASWSALGSGLNNRADALAVHDDGSGPALYVAGEFTTAGGVAANRIARWDGASWSALGSGLNNRTYALAVHDDGSGPALYAGGEFTTAGCVSASRIAKWDGATWSALGSGVGGDVLLSVSALAVHDDGGGPALYAGGSFQSAGGVDTDHVARWNGSSWSAVGGGLASGVYDLIVHDDGSGPCLYAGGGFRRRLARWDGSSWTALGLGMNDAVLALASWDDGDGPALYAGGEFVTSPARDAHLAKWGCRPPTVKKRKL